MSIQVRDVIQPPPEWYAWINSPEREAAMRASGQLAADATDSDASSVRAPDGFSRSLSIRDVGAAPSQQGGAAVIDLRDPQNARDAYDKFTRLHNDCKDALEGLKTEHAKVKGERDDRAQAADGAGAGEVLDLSQPHAIARERLQSQDGRLPSERIEAVDGGAGEVVDLQNLIPPAFFGLPR